MTDSEDLEHPTGTQLLDRAVAILKLLGQAGEGGARAAAIAEAVALKASTAHRIISALERHNLVEREHATKQYRLSVALLALGSQAAEGTGLRRVCRPALLRLAAETGDTIFLMARTGVNTVCVDRQEGTYLIASLTGHIGGQIPVGVGPASQAILACLPQDEAEAIVAINAARYAAFNRLTPREVLDELPRIQARGYAVDDGRLVEGISAIAVPIRPSGRDVVASISIDMTSARLSPDRRERIVASLKREVAEIESMLTAPRRRRTKS
jgi:DNA-binding IclR family transcriptional regulator